MSPESWIAIAVSLGSQLVLGGVALGVLKKGQEALKELVIQRLDGNDAEILRLRESRHKADVAIQRHEGEMRHLGAVIDDHGKRIDRIEVRHT